MLSTTLSLCVRCRHSLVSSNLWRRGIETSAIVQRGKSKSLKSPPFFRQHSDRPQYAKYGGPRRDNYDRGVGMKRQYVDTPDRARTKLNEGLFRWACLPATLARLKAMGVGEEHAQLLLDMFVEEYPMTRGGWFPPEEDEKWQMQRIQEDMQDSLPSSIDKALTRRFMAWAVDTLQTGDIVPPHVYSTLSAVQNAVDYTHPTEWYPSARMLRRKVHMHVGPTNSGKTHNALRALAASRQGVYASPLRLLAYEVFHRLNNGRIVPLGADPSAPPETFKRACNLVTGEEVRTVDTEASLLSCTVEMIDTNKRYDVAVVDEIQMLSDPDRGGAWTAAVLGLHAEELHLCGEAGAVPLVQSMLEEVGDELIVHRYERLTPLTVASESLNGDLKKIQKGDCVVAFSRTMLFGLKKQIETETGMRCAIIYGRLPPEVRTEQAERFNDPNSEYDVLIGSDAIGMGLNLKIKRIVFASSMKWDGTDDKSLSLSQLKQIAGRAGRFGMHGDESGGVVTTLHERDLSTVRKAVETRAVPISKRAVLPTTYNMFHSLEQLIRPRASFGAVFDILRSTAQMSPAYMLRDLDRAGNDVVPIIDESCSDHTLEERLRVLLAPVPWRDTAVSEVAKRFLQMYRTDMNVRLREACDGVGLVEALDEAMALQSASPDSGAGEDILPITPPITTLLRLESLYRVAVVYMWFGMRLPLIFSELEDAVKMKENVEQAIEWCLQQIHAARQKRKEKKHAEWNPLGTLEDLPRSVPSNSAFIGRLSEVVDALALPT